MSWKLMVVDPLLANYDFKVPSRLMSTLNEGSGLAAASSEFDVDAITWGQYGKKGDYIILGPSSVAANRGKTEHIQISGISSSTVSLLTNTVYAYGDADPVTLIGTLVSSGWSLSGGASLIAKGIGFDYSDADMVGHNIGLSMQKLVKPTSPSEADSVFSISLAKPLSIAAYYRLILWYKLSATQDLPDVIFINNSNATVFSQAMVDGEHKFDQVAIVNTTYGTYPAIIKIVAENSLGANPVQFGSLYLGLIMLGHAKFTSSAVSGYVAFPNNPKNDADVSLNTLGDGNISESCNTGIATLSQFGIAKKEVKIQVTFDGTSTFIRDLEILKYHSDHGRLISLEHDLMSGASSGLSLADAVPPVIVGYFDYAIDYSHWDEERPVIEFSFEGI